ncbi:MAG: S8 family peptidase [Prevotella sp.]|nr:S8 family peptidase [Prevotella sp.]
MRKTFTLLFLSIALITFGQVNQKQMHRLDAAAKIQAKATDGQMKSVSIKCDDPSALTIAIKADGYHATAVSDEMVTAVVPADYLRALGDKQHVNRIYGSRPKHFFMDKVRKEVGVDNIRNSDEFETPYTGKGVLVAVIDGGFKYDHVAFKDSEGNSRIKIIWNRKNFSEGEETEPTDIIPGGNDGYEEAEGHGSHTAGIATGSVISQNNYNGMAPEADIIMISSSMEAEEVMEDLLFIDNYAKEKGQPYVVNMSFGEIVGSHDGLSPYDQFFNNIATGGNGRALVTAAGNSGIERVHVGYTFQKDGEKVVVALSQRGKEPVIDLWGRARDGEKHLMVQAYQTKLKGTPVELSFEDDEQVSEEICDYNGKEHYLYVPSNPSSGSLLYSVFVITGNMGDGFDAWTTEQNEFKRLKFEKAGFTSLAGDYESSIGGSGQTAEKAFCVGNYTSRSTVYSLVLGKETDFSSYGLVGTIGDIDGSSSAGPVLNDSFKKPDVAAPGGLVVAPIEFVTESSEEGILLVDKVLDGDNECYYMASAGTSMAAPVVTGAMALWLQANPNLSCEQLHVIVQTTSRHDEFTGDKEWSPKWGYGKIDVYNGLKMALEMADQTGIPAIYGSEQPISLKKQAGQWRVLFNNAEPMATVTVFDQLGRLCRSHSLNQPQRGQEAVINLQGLPSGVYVVHISTAKSHLSRKLVVE